MAACRRSDMEVEHRKDALVLATPVLFTLSPPPYSRTWGNDSVREEDKKWAWRSKLRWRSSWHWGLHGASTAAFRTAKRTTKPVLDKISAYSYKIWPALKKVPFAKKQCIGLFLVMTCGVLPLVFLGYFTPRLGSMNGTYPFVRIFQDKILSCGDSLYGKPQNSTVRGIEKLFVLDRTFGIFSFSEVKMIDTLWDLFVGRGVQLLAWWAAYSVFSNALMRAIERYPASFQIFQRIALEGPSLQSLSTLLREICAAKSRRTTALFSYMLLSTTYVLCIPVFLGAMTGYDSTTIAWVDIDDSNNIVPASQIKQAWIITGTLNETFKTGNCQNYDLQYDLSDLRYEQAQECDCQFPNKTIMTPLQRSWNYPSDCMEYPGNIQTYQSHYYSYKESTRNCNSTFDVNIHGRMFDAEDLTSTFGYCYNSIAYNASSIFDKTRCLPDTANPTYQWGFTSLLSGIFVILQTVWCLTMYAVWQDAQFKSTLVKSGYQMTPLRAAFAMAKAAAAGPGWARSSS